MSKVSVYPRRQKMAFGEYLTQFYKDVSLWPPELVKFYEKRYPKLNPIQQSKGLTVEMLLEWMAEHTGMTQLVSPEHKGYYMALLSNWGRWRHNPDRGGDSAALIVAIADCGIVLGDDDKPITQPRDLLAYLFGTQQPDRKPSSAENAR